MAGYSNEFKVGLLTIGAIAAVVWGVLRTDDRPDGAVDGYNLTVHFPNAEGTYPSTQVKLAGVSVGSVRKVELDDTVTPPQAKLTLEFRGTLQIPRDSTLELKTEGVLGDKFMRLNLGKDTALLTDGEEIQSFTGPDLMATLTAQADKIGPVLDKLGPVLDDVKVTTANLKDTTTELKASLDEHDVIERVSRTVDKLEATSNKIDPDEIAAIIQNLKDTSTELKSVATKAGTGVDDTLARVQGIADKADTALADVASITGKIDRGEGTVGALINDTTTISQINHTVAEVNEAVDAIMGLQTEVNYQGLYYLGSDPSEDGFTENPISGASKNQIGLRIMPQEDYWYLFEFVDHPYGDFTYEETITDGVSVEELVRTHSYRFSFQFAKRWQNVVVRFGIKESSGGLGADLMLARDRVMLSADLYDFGYGSWPLLTGVPNLTLTGRLNPLPHVYLTGGADNVIFDAQHGFFTGFVGGGFYFTDQDIKWILATLPLPG